MDKLTSLHVAAKHGDVNVMNLVITQGAFLDSALDGPEEQGFTPLHLAVQGNHIECAKLLLEHGASVFSKIEGVCHPIHLTVFNNNLKMTSLLLDHGADVNLKFNNDFFEEFKSPLHRSLWQDHNLPLLHYSILRNYKSMTKLLITRGADVNLKTSLEKTTLMQAVEVSNKRLVEYLIKEKKINVNDRDIFGQPVLHFLMLNASRKDLMYNKKEDYLTNKKLDILDELLNAGADVNARFPENEKRSSIIHYMIKYGFSEGVFILLIYQSDLDFSEIDLTSIYSTQILRQHIKPDIENDDLYFDALKRRYSQITFFIVEKAIRDQLLGLPVDKNLILEKPIHEWESMEDWQLRIDSYGTNMKIFLNSLKKKKVGDITFFYLMTCDMNKLVKLISNKHLKGFNVSKVQRVNMPEFYIFLDYRLRIARIRRKLLEDCAEIIFKLFVCVPYDCCENIVTNFSNEELVLLHPKWISMHDLLLTTAD